MIRKIAFPLSILILALAACAQPGPTATPQPTDLPPEPVAEEATRPALAPAQISEEQMTAEATEQQLAESTPESQPPAEPQETAQPQADAEDLLAADVLANMTYSSDFTADGTAPLSDGQYSEQAAPDSATETRVWLTDHIAYGDLNGQPVAAVVLVSDPGGSGTFYSLHVVGLEDGQPLELAYTQLGDRVEIDSLEVAGEQITVQMVIAGPDDPLCCPTQEVVQVYELQDGELVKTADEVVGSAAEAAADSIVNRIWGWQERQEDGSDALTIAEPQAYTLIFQEDGSFQYTADCSPGAGLYSTDTNGDITLLTSSESMDECGPDSHASAMKEGLRQAHTYRRENGELSLVWGDQSIVDRYVDLGTAVTAAGSLHFGSDQISLDTQGLYETWMAVDVPAQAVDDSSPAGPQGLPDHVEIYFDYDDPTEREGGAIMYIIPVEAYIELYANAGFAWIDKNIDAIYEFTRAPQEPLPTNGVPILPNEELAGINDLAVQIAGTGAGSESASQSGYRFIGRTAQDPNPVTNQNLRYIYQGFTNDGKYLVSFFSPIRSDELPDDAGDVPQETFDALSSDAAGYLEQEAVRLSGLPAEIWEPDLAALDALVNSLRIEGMVIAGLQNTVWHWTGQVNDTSGGEVTEKALQGDYSAEYGGDLVLGFVADCNPGSSSYELIAGGMVGQMQAQPAASTPAECGPDSFAQEFVALLAETQSYRVLPGGREMILPMPDGGGDYVLRESDEPSGTSGLEDDSGEGNTAPAIAPGSTAELVEKGIALDVTGIADTYAWVVQPETPFHEQPGGQGLPGHVLVTFDGEDAAEVVSNNGRRLYVFPAQPYIELYEAAGRDVVGNQIERLQDLIDSGQGRETAPDGWMPLLPPPDSLVEHWAQFRDYDFTGGMGVRYVGDSPFRQSIGLWGNDTTAYYYQGLTHDGRYYVSLWWPVSTEALPDTAEDAPPELREMAENPETQARYIQETQNSLNALPPGAFGPSLAQLDAMVNSLAIGEK